MASQKPTILLIPGAYHRSVCYQRIIPLLEAQSYPVVTTELRSVNASSTSLVWEDDVKGVLEVLLPLLDEGKEVVIVGHSYGGVPAYVSTAGNSIAERAAAGKKGGVKSVVFLCAFAMAEKNKGVTEYNNPSDTTWVTFGEDGLLVLNDWAKTVLYEDLPEEEREYWFAKAGTQNVGVFLTPVPMAATDMKVPSMYLVAETDRAVQLVLQEKMLTGAPAMKSMRIKCGHSPFLSHPKETVEVIIKGAEL